MTEEKKDSTMFDKMKKMEELKKKRLISTVLTEVKKLAKEIQENKELCNLYLEQVCKDDKEQKQIIDWINNLDDVKPDEDRMKELRQRVKDGIKKEKEQVEKKAKDDPERFYQPLVYNTSNLVHDSLMLTDLSTTTCNTANGINVM